MTRWTVEDLDRLAADGLRRELIDGVLYVMPASGRTHQSTMALLGTWLMRNCPEEFIATQSVDVYFSEKNRFTPDVLVVKPEDPDEDQKRFPPHEVLLAVEIVSPGSTHMDRVTKPAIYAEGHIPFFWRIERDPALVVHTFALDIATMTYASTGVFSDEVVVGAPWPIRLPLKEITP